MPTQTIVYIILAIGIAFLLAFLQYRTLKSTSKYPLLFIGLRFVTYLSILLLLIDPKLKQQTYTIERPELIIAIDNSSSVAMLEDKEKISEFVAALKTNKALNDRFQIREYLFGRTLRVSDTLTFTEKQTNISKTLESLNEIYKNKTAPTLLLTDGNQTLGVDYQYTSKSYKNPVFPIILGDTAAYTDLKIERLNANRYAYLKNKFPVEVVLAYDGELPVNSKFSIRSGNTVLYTENVRFSKENNSRIITAELTASTIGVQHLNAEIRPIEEEKNTANNTQFFAVEVIDEKAHIAIATTLIHPDIGALKKMILHNQQWEVTVAHPDDIAARIFDFQLLIVYQPNAAFKNLFDSVAQQNKNTFVISGTQTHWNFLNAAQNDFNKNNTNAIEDVQPKYNANYLPFLTEDIGLNSFPPLQTLLGTINFTPPPNVLLYQKIGAIATEYPLLATFENEGRRGAVLFGQGLWKWRMEQYRKTKNFEEFDIFFGKLVQYLLSDKQKDRMEIAYESFYYGNNSIIISAEFFDENYSFSPRAALEITVKDKLLGTVRVFPMLLKNRNYEVDLSALPASDYEFTVTEKGARISKSGSFRIIAFDVEQQFLNADVKRLQELGITTSGASFFMEDKERVVQDLRNDKRFTPVQKSKENFISLIDWKYLLILIIGSLSAEWFLRKYNGLI